MRVAESPVGSVSAPCAVACVPCLPVFQIVRSGFRQLGARAKRVLQIRAMDGSSQDKSPEGFPAGCTNHQKASRQAGSKASPADICIDVLEPLIESGSANMPGELQLTQITHHDSSTQQTLAAVAQPQQNNSSRTTPPSIKLEHGQRSRDFTGESSQVFKKARLQGPAEQQQEVSVEVLKLAEQQQPKPVEPRPDITLIGTLASTEQHPEVPAAAVASTAAEPQPQQVPIMPLTPAQQQQAAPHEHFTPLAAQQQQTVPTEPMTSAGQQQTVPFMANSSAEEQQQAVLSMAMTTAEQQQQEMVPFGTLTSTQQQQQTVPCKLEGTTPEGLGSALLAHGVLRERVTSFGCQAGQWVADDSIIAVLAAICSDEASHFTHGGKTYELVTCYLNSRDMSVDIPNYDLTAPPQHPQCILVVHTSAEGAGQHFSSLIVNPEHQLVHAFDSLSRWQDGLVKAVLRGLYPNLDLFRQHAYKLSNNTGKIKQTGATCGPWALWSLVAYVFNYKQCRHEGSDVVDCTVLRGGALPFWRAVTC